jgi:hypothetical protein
MWPRWRSAHAIGSVADLFPAQPIDRFAHAVGPRFDAVCAWVSLSGGTVLRSPPPNNPRIFIKPRNFHDVPRCRYSTNEIAAQGGEHCKCQSYVQAPVQSTNPHTGEPQSASLETYSGTIILNLSENNGTKNRFHCTVLVPMRDTTIRSYGVEDNQPTSPFQIATCVSLAATSPNGAHVAINAIDQSSAGLISQTFDGVP